EVVEERTKRLRIGVERDVAAQVAASRERRAGTSDDDRADVGRLVGLDEQPPQLGRGVLVDGVALLGPLQREKQDAPGALVDGGDLDQRSRHEPDPFRAGTNTRREPSMRATTGSPASSSSCGTPSMRATRRAPSGR